MLEPCLAQFGEAFHKPIPVTIRHAPQTALKGVTRIIVQDFEDKGKFADSCGAQLAGKLREKLGNSKQFEILDSADLEAISREHNLQLSGQVNAETVTQMGQFLGAAALLSGQVTKCEVKTGQVFARYNKKLLGPTTVSYVIETRADVWANIGIVDVSTRRKYSPKAYQAPVRREANSPIGQPVPVEANDVLAEAYDMIAEQFTRTILPWYEKQEVFFFHDDKLNVSKSVELVRTGDYERALSMLDAAIADYEKSSGDNVDRKLLSKAYYNRGMCRVILGMRKEGRADLEKSNEFNHSDNAIKAIQLCDRIIQQDETFKLQEATAIQLGAPKSTSESSQEILTNADVIAMSQAKMSDSLITAKIKSSKCNFDVTTKGLLALKKAGVSDAVIEMMTQRPH
jgi:tetratricopeptide (TPR) repeat protein